MACVDQFTKQVRDTIYFASSTQPVQTTQDCSLYGRVGQPSHRAVYFTYLQICRDMNRCQLLYITEKTNAPKPATKTTKNQQVEKQEKCTSDQSSRASLGVLGYASLNRRLNKYTSNNRWKKNVT